MVNLEGIKIAAQWWADQVFDSRELNKFSNGANDASSVMSMLIQNSTSIEAQKKIKPEDKQNYINKFVELFSLEKQDWVVVDYHPCEFLTRVLKDSGCDDTLIHSYPIKTSMVIEDNAVSVSAGYGAPHETIWALEVVT